jgi:hypothetical protein
MEVIFQCGVAQKMHPTSLMEKAPGIEQDFHQLGAYENRLPADDRAGDEVRIVGLAKLLATSAHGEPLWVCVDDFVAGMTNR